MALWFKVDSICSIIDGQGKIEKKLKSQFNNTVLETKSVGCTQMVNGGNKMFLIKCRKSSLFHFTLIFRFIICLEKKKKAWFGPAGTAEWFLWPEMTHLPVSGSSPRKCTVKAEKWLSTVTGLSRCCVLLRMDDNKNPHQSQKVLQSSPVKSLRVSRSWNWRNVLLKADRVLSLKVGYFEVLAQVLRY